MEEAFRSTKVGGLNPPIICHVSLSLRATNQCDTMRGLHWRIRRSAQEPNQAPRLSDLPHSSVPSLYFLRWNKDTQDRTRLTILCRLGYSSSCNPPSPPHTSGAGDHKVTVENGGLFLKKAKRLTGITGCARWASCAMGVP